MRSGRYALARCLVIAGLLGLAVFLVGDHYHLPIIPPDDFARGLWFGCCIGAEIMGVFYFVTSDAGPAA